MDVVKTIGNVKPMSSLVSKCILVRRKVSLKHRIGVLEIDAWKNSYHGKPWFDLDHLTSTSKVEHS